MRRKWTEQVLAIASTIFKEHFFGGEVGQRDIENKLMEVAANRRQREGQPNVRARVM
jgi:hypothetical protein